MLRYAGAYRTQHGVLDLKHTHREPAFLIERSMTVLRTIYMLVYVTALSMTKHVSAKTEDG